jgi:hypothetical protein
LRSWSHVLTLCLTCARNWNCMTGGSPLANLWALSIHWTTNNPQLFCSVWYTWLLLAGTCANSGMRPIALATLVIAFLQSSDWCLRLSLYWDTQLVYALYMVLCRTV